MGQISLPVLNRTGYSTFWQSVWDEKHNFNRSLKEDYLLRSIIPYFFFDRVSKQKQFLNFEVVNSSLILKDLEYWTQFQEPLKLYSKITTYVWRKKKLPYYVLKIWILKFQTWLLIFFSMYSPIKFYSLFTKRKKKYNLSKHFGYYYMFLISLKYNNNYLKHIKYVKNIF